MDDSLVVCGQERLADLFRNRACFVPRHRSSRDPLGQRRPVDQLHDQRMDAARVLEPVNVRDVGVVERREHLRFAMEARQSLGIVGEEIGQDLDRDVAVQLGVMGTIDLAHSTFA